MKYIIDDRFPELLPCHVKLFLAFAIDKSFSEFENKTKYMCICNFRKIG